MRLSAFAVVAALLGLAPPAAAATFTVNSSSDSGPGSLRQALADANATAEYDLIVFADSLSGTTIAVDSTLTALQPVTIDGGGDTTVQQSQSAAGALLRYEPPAAGSGIRDIELAGPVGSGNPATALVSTAASDMTIEASRLHDAETAGVSIDGGAQRVRLARNSIYLNGTKPVSFDAAGVNGGIAAPADLRVGPRQADGSLPIRGSTASGGTLELFGFTEMTPLRAVGVDPGEFAVVIAPEPSPGTPIGATITDPSGNTSEYATTTVPDDVQGPVFIRAVATSLNTIDVQTSEPVDALSLQPEDFTVEMAGVTRPVVGATASPDSARFTLFFDDRWDYGDAGILRVNAAGAVADRLGNVSLTTPELRVGGAPGDFEAPVITRFRLNPRRRVCFVLGPRCKRDRMAIIFRSSEDGDTFVTVFRGTKLIGERRYTGQPGANFIRFDGKIRGRRLKPGLYRMYVAMQDEVGNRTPVDQQPSALFRVKSTKRRR